MDHPAAIAHAGGADQVGAEHRLAAWTPYTDPRLAILAATYRLLLDTGHADIGQRDHPYPDGQVVSGQQR
jgi:hypothetical protein